jgi:nucleoside-diphosphate-sugar epimerase
MPVLVTGGTGFLGRRIVEALLASGQEVAALSRSEASDQALRALGAVPVRGDLRQGEITLPPIDAVVHAAAHFRLAGPRAPYFEANVNGTETLLSAARKAGAKSFVYISAAAVVMDDAGSALKHVDEQAPTYPQSNSPYIASKAQAEAAVLATNALSFRTLALRPPGIWGKGDAFSAALPSMLKWHMFGFIGGGSFPYVTCHVDNVVEAALCALKAKAGGKAYFINDRELITFRAFVIDIAKSLGLDASRTPSMPYRLACMAGGLLEALWSLAGSSADPPISRTMVRLIGREFTTSDAGARRDLGYAGHRTRADGLACYR